MSLACLLTAVMTNLWVHTVEPVSLPVGLAAITSLYHIPGDAAIQNSPKFATQMRRDFAVDFAIGLWTVCPRVHNDMLFLGEASPPMTCTHIRYLDWSWSDINYRTLGLWTTVDCTTSFISRMRLSTLFTIASVAILGSASLLTFLATCIRGSKMLLASGLYALGGLVLGCALVIFVCILSDECSSQPQPPPLPLFHPDRLPVISPHYYYGWSFVLAVLAFLGSEISAVLCFSAFINHRFDSEEEFVKSLPGMERKINEHLGGLAWPEGTGAQNALSHHLRAESSLSDHQRGPDGSHLLSSALTPHRLSSCSGHEHNYDPDGHHHHHHHHHHHQQQLQQLQKQQHAHTMEAMASSPSLSSGLGITHTSRSHAHAIPVTAEVINPADISPSQPMTFDGINRAMTTHRSPSSSPPRFHLTMATSRGSNLMTNAPPSSSPSALPLQNSFNQAPVRREHFLPLNGDRGPVNLSTDMEDVVIPPPPMSEYGSFPEVAVNGHHSELPASSLLNGSAHHHHHSSLNRGSMLLVKRNGDITPINGNGRVNNFDANLGFLSESPSRLALATATIPRHHPHLDSNGRKKKSVTIGTFTTMEAFDPDSTPAKSVV